MDDDQIIRQAAEKWLRELDENVIPYTYDDADRHGYEIERDQLREALERTK